MIWIKPCWPNVGSHTGMTLLPVVAALILIAPGPLAASDSDAVNERIPVRKAEMEAHWKVDCAALWQALNTAVAGTAQQRSCALPADLQHQLKLCAFIYQPPGQDYTDSCPDYRELLIQLESPGSGDACARLAHPVQAQPDCPLPSSK